MNEQNDKGSSGYPEGQADYGGPKGGGADEGMSKEEWLRQNPDGAFDPDEAPGEGMTKEEYLRQNPDGGESSGKGGGERH